MNGPTVSLSAAESFQDHSAPDSGRNHELLSHPMALSGVETAEKGIGPGAIDTGGKSPSRSRSPAQPAMLSGQSSSSPAKLQEMSGTGGGDTVGSVKNGLDALRSGVASLGLAKSKLGQGGTSEEVGTSEGDRELHDMARKEMEIEMQ